MVTEKMETALQGDAPWAMLLMSLNSLSDFRALYGFVAADDVLRAVTLMVQNAVREHGNEDDFIGHLDAEDFLIITDADSVARIRQRIETRIRQSRAYFYPLRDRDRVRQAAETDHLRLSSGVVTHSDAHTFQNAEDLRNALQSALVPESAS